MYPGSVISILTYPENPRTTKERINYIFDGVNCVTKISNNNNNMNGRAKFNEWMKGCMFKLWFT